MKANLINSFAAGLLISASVCGIVYFSQSTENEKSDQLTADSLKKEEMKTNLSKEEMKTSLTNDGYVILTKKELEEQLAAAEKKVEIKDKQTQKEQKKDTKKQGNEKVIYRTVINVASGMTSIEVGDALEQGEIIDNGMTFYKEVEKRGLENDLKPGVFKVDSTMSIDEVINTIFKK